MMTLKPFHLQPPVWVKPCLLLVACLVLSSCIYVPKSLVNPDVLELLDAELLALRANDAETLLDSRLYYDYDTKQYRKGTQEDVQRVRDFLDINPELWNFQSYTITKTYGDTFLAGPRYRIVVELQYKDGRTRVDDFYFRYLDGRWWVVIT